MVITYWAKMAIIMDHVAHVILFDTHPFFQQSFVRAAEFLVKIGKADKSKFEFMKEMKGKRERFSTEPFEKIKEYTDLVWPSRCGLRIGASAPRQSLFRGLHARGHS